MDAVSILMIGFLIATATWTISFLLARLRNDIIIDIKKLLEETKKENKKDETN